MATVGIPDDASEWEVRNAISRAYYAVFHMCHAWLALRHVAKPSEHLTLHRTSMWSSVRFLGSDCAFSLRSGKMRLQSAYG